MYMKNLNTVLRLRISESDAEFLQQLSKKRSVSVSEVVRSLISEYRHSLETVEILSKALEIAQSEKNGGLVDGNSKADIIDKL